MYSDKKILVTRDFPDIGIDMLKNEGFDLTIWTQAELMDQEELIKQAKKHHCILCTLTDKIDAHFLNECRHIEMISQYAVGYDNIDVKLATKLGIPVGFTPDAMSEATADVAFGLMITTARKMFYHHKTILKGRWDYFRPKGNLGIELMGKTLGIFGLGRIGFKMAQRCKNAYHMNIIYCNRNRNIKAEKMVNAKSVSFDDLLAQSDILSVHSQLSKETRQIFNLSAFKRMKPEALFINTSRGLVHDEKDLIKALETNELWGAGLDVTNPEPMKKDNPLLSMPNVSVLPHIGSGTVEARDEMSFLAAKNIIAFFKNGNIPNIVNPEVMKSLDKKGVVPGHNTLF